MQIFESSQKITSLAVRRTTFLLAELKIKSKSLSYSPKISADFDAWLINPWNFCLAERQCYFLLLRWLHFVLSAFAKITKEKNFSFAGLSRPRCTLASLGSANKNYTQFFSLVWNVDIWIVAKNNIIGGSTDNFSPCSTHYKVEKLVLLAKNFCGFWCLLA